MRDLSRDQLLAELRALRPEFERRGVTGMSLFGSRARGDNRPDSDVDLIVEVRNGGKFSMFDMVGVGHIVEEAIELPTSLVDRRRLDRDHPAFFAAVQRDKVQVF